MAKSVMYAAIGEESSRGTAQVSTVGFIPLSNPVVPNYEPEDTKRKEVRGEDSVLGDTSARRMGEKWSASLEIPFFTEAGTTVGMIGTLLKHFFGKATSVQNATTGQYAHIIYPVPDPFASGNLGTKALTLNMNLNEGATMRNYPYIGGRIKSITLDQEPGQPLKITVECFGQNRASTTSELGSAAFAAENLRCDASNLTVYTGTITRVGTAPNFTDITFGSATSFTPDKISLKLENGFTDINRLDGNIYAGITRVNGQFKATMELTIDWATSGFNSVNEFNSRVAAVSETNFAMHWDSGTQAGTGDNHGLIIDLPRMQRVGGLPEFSLENDPMISLSYEGFFDSTTTQYLAGLLLKNTATAI